MVKEIMPKFQMAPNTSSNRLDPVEVPEFLLILGENGVGKTRFLQDLRKGQILHSAIEDIPAKEGYPDPVNGIREAKVQVFDRSILHASPLTPNLNDADGTPKYENFVSNAENRLSVDVAPALQAYRQAYEKMVLDLHFEGKDSGPVAV